MFGRKKRPGGPPSTATQYATPPDPRMPGSAGYHGNGIGKNAMPEMRFNFVRPDEQQKR